MESTLNLSGLAHSLVQHKRLSLQDVLDIQSLARDSNLSFISQLVLSGKMTAKEVGLFASNVFGCPFFDLSFFDISHLPRGIVSFDVVRSKRIVPMLKRGTRLSIATSDPTQSFHDLTFETGGLVDLIVVEDNKLDSYIEKYCEDDLSKFSAQTEDALDGLEVDAPFTSDVEASEADIGDVPVVKFIHKILTDGITVGASDIHFEPYENFYRIRYRVDGQLKEIVRPPQSLKDTIASRIKVISQLDISEKRVPQDGRLKLRVSKTRTIDFRVSTLPTLFGEKIVMRILDQSAATLDIEQLGFEPIQKQLILDAIARPYGMVLVTGPTGSGKTVSLYSCLNILNAPDKNISTAEDPVEINLAGVNQVGVNEKAGLTFASALRSFLRQDPDIIMVGEIRDFDTADIAIKAAQTGHMVFSTLHTNNAPATLSRLLNMGVAPFNIASSVLLIMAQRLIRRLCPRCKVKIDIPKQILIDAGFKEEDFDGSWHPFGPVGCDECRGRGYKGRTGIYELMPITDDITRIIMNNGNAVDIADQAEKEGMIDLRRSGLLKVMQGITSLSEVEATTNE